MNYDLEIIYLILKIITLATFLVASVGIGLNILWQIYKNNKEFKKEKAEKEQKENAKTEEEKLHQNKIKRGLGLTDVPKDCYRKEVHCYNCDTYKRNYVIKKGMTEEKFRKITLCDHCDVRLDYKGIKK